MTMIPIIAVATLGVIAGTVGGTSERFGVYRNEQQHYIGPVFTYDLSHRWSVRLEPAFGLSKVSDPFMLRTGVAYTFGPHGPKATASSGHAHM